MKLLGCMCARALATAPAAVAARLTARQTRDLHLPARCPPSPSRRALPPALRAARALAPLLPSSHSLRSSRPLSGVYVWLSFYSACATTSARRTSRTRRVRSHPPQAECRVSKCTIGCIFVVSHLSASCALLCAAQRPVALLPTKSSSHSFPNPSPSLQPPHHHNRWRKD